MAEEELEEEEIVEDKEGVVEDMKEVVEAEKEVMKDEELVEKNTEEVMEAEEGVMEEEEVLEEKRWWKRRKRWNKLFDLKKFTSLVVFLFQVSDVEVVVGVNGDIEYVEEDLQHKRIPSVHCWNSHSR